MCLDNSYCTVLIYRVFKMVTIQFCLSIIFLLVIVYEVTAFQCYFCHGLWGSGCAQGDISSMTPIDCPTGVCYVSNVSTPYVGVSRDCAVLPCVVLEFYGIVEHPCVECTTNLCNTYAVSLTP